MDKNLRSIEKFFLLFSTTSFIFLWNYSFVVDFNYIIFIHAIGIFIFSLFKKKIKLLNISNVLVLLLLIHFLTTAYIIEEINNLNFIYIFAVYFLSYFICYYFDFILKNLNLILNVFLIIFFFNILFDIAYTYYNENLYLTHFSQEFPNTKNIGFLELIFNCKYSYFRPFEGYEYLIYKEISHLGFIAPAILLSKILISKKENIIFKFLFLFFIFFIVLFFNTSLIFSLLISIIFLILFLFKKFSYLNLSIFIFILVFCVTIFSTNTTCNTKLLDTFNLFNKNINMFSINSNKEDKVEVSVPDQLYNNEKSEFYKWEKTYYPNLSSTIFFNSFLITLKALKKSLIGFGFNNYDIAAKYYFKNNKSLLESVGENGFERIKNYNTKDGSNNFAKTISEFGIISIFFVYILYKFIKNPLISTENKVFYITLVISQLIRGAGYFNGGFIFAILIIIVSLSRKNYE